VVVMRARVRFPSSTEIAGCLRAWGGKAGPGPRKSDAISGFAMALAAPGWLLAASGVAALSVDLPELELIQAGLLLHLQEVDDEVDGQSRCLGGNMPHLAAILGRLRATIGSGPLFWQEFARLRREQENTSRWEIARRGRRQPVDLKDDLERIPGRAALLRWPAAGVAHLLGRPALRARLDRLVRRLLLVALLLDDLGDVLDDAEQGRCNAVLMSGHATLEDGSGFHAAVRRGTAFVAGWLDREIEALQDASNDAAGAPEACRTLRGLAARSTASVSRWATAGMVSTELRNAFGGR
jgi:hypothetical protein